MPEHQVDPAEAPTLSQGPGRSKKRLIVCCDGTWNRLDAPNPTNVVRTAEAALPEDGNGIEQIVFYDEGVGSGEGRTKLLDKIIGGAFGAGLEKNIEDAYRFLVFNYDDSGEEPDEIFVFGFSRGAYTARSLCGLIERCGIAHRSHARMSSQALRLYRNRGHVFGPADYRQFIADHGRPADITFLGVWDTVGARGLPRRFALSALVNHRHRFHNVQLGQRVRRTCHAIAVDERRSAFEVTPFETVSEEQAKTVEQLWFPGDHGCVGGGKKNKESKGLYDGAFRWMMEQAMDAGLAMDPRALAPPTCNPNPLDYFDAGVLKKWWNPAQWAYLLVGHADRMSPPGIDSLHASTKARWHGIPTYRPEPLKSLAAELKRQP